MAPGPLFLHLCAGTQWPSLLLTTALIGKRFSELVFLSGLNPYEMGTPNHSVVAGCILEWLVGVVGMESVDSGNGLGIEHCHTALNC